jgi:enediyne biosynthesis protein E4
MTFNKKLYLYVIILPFVLNGCNNKNVRTDKFHFTKATVNETNINFNNKITESDSVNVFTNEYMYNGSGVGIGDFNNDGLQDVFFCGSMVSSKIYINKGNFKFEDITEKAGVQTNTWCTGASIVDINNDGFMDVYVTTSHSKDSEKRKNLLFINDGIFPSSVGEGRGEVHFTEQAASYGLADTGYATQAAFVDYDKDGDLDMYLLNHRLYSHTANNLQPKDTSGTSPAQDKLYRNEGVPSGKTNPVFIDVSKKVGILEDGYGLGLVITDANNDNWPDIYVANDYISNDLLWLNNKNGTFTNVIATSIMHQSYNSMGVDAGDINNDGLTDLAVLDMLPETNERKKMMFQSTNQEKYDMQQRFGYQPSFVRNMLQLNNGNRKQNNRSEPFYSEIGQLAGIFETDWSWSVLMADFDNDGWKDIHITNGLGKDMTNNDYAAFRNMQVQSNYTFGGNSNQNVPDKNTVALLRKNMDEYPAVKINNYLFHNNGNQTAEQAGLGFRNITTQAGLGSPSLSNGAAYVDLDNDGDLDLITNNINEEASIWKNEIRQSEKDSNQNFLSVQLKGSVNNLNGIGSKITLYNKTTQQYLEQSPVRGFSSSVDYRLHFGVDGIKEIDSLKIEWTDDKVQVIKNVKVNQLLTIKYEDANFFIAKNDEPIAPLFDDITMQSSINFKHSETQNFDFGNHIPLMQKYSQLGPCIATGDVNGDGLDDFFVGGAANQSGKICMQKQDGNFIIKNIIEGNKMGEDLGAVLFDADGDKDVDLLITGGSFEFAVPKYNQPRLYLNDSKGNFTIDETALPSITDITDAAAVADFDNDGDIDVFIGGRMQQQKYPQSPRSYILQNNNGKFIDATKKVCSALEFSGMITDALFTDFDNDKKADLIICGEWMPVRFFKNDTNKFIEVTNEAGLNNMNGLWRSLQQADIDKDGDMDYVVGNIGLNNRFHITTSQPLFLYAKDMDKNNFSELVPAYYIKNSDEKFQLFPSLDRNQLAEQVPIIKKKYLLHKDYCKVTMTQLKNDFGAADWGELICETASSIWIENIGNGKFKPHELPIQAQFAPVNCIVAEDEDADGNIDILIAGNEYQAALSIGRYDASYGLVLKGNGKGNFVPVNIAGSGLIIDGDIKDLKIIETKNKEKILIAAPNDDKLKIFKLNYYEKKRSA